MNDELPPFAKAIIESVEKSGSDEKSSGSPKELSQILSLLVQVHAILEAQKASIADTNYRIDSLGTLISDAMGMIESVGTSVDSLSSMIQKPDTEEGVLA